jgi:hypothetical protein
MFQKYQLLLALVVLISFVIGIPRLGLVMPFPKFELVEHGGGPACEACFTLPRSWATIPTVKNGDARRPRYNGDVRTETPGDDPTADAASFAGEMAEKYPHLSRAEKHRVLVAIKTALPPKPSVGRPCRDDVTEAMRMEADGVTRGEIYGRLGKTTRDQQHALREAMRQRRARKRKRDKPASVTPTIPATVFSI